MKILKNKKGNEIVLLNPSEKGAKFARELKSNCKFTNSGQYKLGENSKSITLTDEQRSYRAGYLDAQKDSARAYKAIQAKKGKKK